MAALNVTVQAPSSMFGAQYTSPDGTQYQITSAGLLTIPVTWLSVVLNAGFTLPTDDAIPNDAVTAFATGGKTSATLLTAGINRVTTVATAADSVKLPVSIGGMWIIVTNDAANPMQVFGSGTDTINGVATATGVSQPPKSSVLYSCPVAGVWQTTNLGSGYAGSLQTESATNGITAFATGGQASATQLATLVNRITTCATAGDSVKLPASAVGLAMVVTNSGAAALDIFPATGDLIDTLAANTAIRIAAGSTVAFYCSVAGTWNSTPTPLPYAKFVSVNVTAGTLAAGNITGAASVNLTSTNAVPGTQTTRTATQMFGDTPNARVGDSYLLRITNTGAGTLTLAGGTGVTVTGTATVATNTFSDFVVTFTSATAVTIQKVGQGTMS